QVAAQSRGGSKHSVFITDFCTTRGRFFTFRLSTIYLFTGHITNCLKSHSSSRNHAITTHVCSNHEHVFTIPSFTIQFSASHTTDGSSNHSRSEPCGSFLESASTGGATHCESRQCEPRQCESRQRDRTSAAADLSARSDSGPDHYARHARFSRHTGRPVPSASA